MLTTASDLFISSPMKTLEIIKVPDPLLRTKSELIERVDDELRHLIKDMLETMYEAPGVGLAAIQVAIPKRLFVIDISKEDEPDEPMAFINPEILSRSDEMRLHEEGCLSLPEVFVELERPSACVVAYTDDKGKRHKREFSGMMSTVIQHELDHLNGTLFVDHLSRLKRDRIIKKYLKDLKSDQAL